MSEIRYRLAKPSDAKEIADVHWHVRDRYTEGVFLMLGKKFLEAYYKVTLNDPWEINVCAINKDDKIVGFAGTTLNAKLKNQNIRRHKFSLGLAALFAILKKPSLLKGVWQRYQSIKGDSNSTKFLSGEGVRGGYWCWLKSDSSLKAIEMSTIKNNILRELGVKELFFEVDKINKSVYKYHLKVNKAEPIEEIKLPDGRERVLMRKKL